MTKKRAVVICPGRGSYTKESLNYLNRQSLSFSNQLAELDGRRVALALPKLSALDQAQEFKSNLHTKGEHAASLIYACAWADYLSLDFSNFDVVAMTGNSMGWYIALALSQALQPAAAFDLIQTMGSMTAGTNSGGQILYPIIDANWRIDLEKIGLIDNLISEFSLAGKSVYNSIFLGGYRVIAGETKVLQEFMRRLPVVEHFPFQLINHSAFHTPILDFASQNAFQNISIDGFGKPSTALIDGRGYIWSPLSTNQSELYRYTLGHQVYEPYDFTSAIKVALKEFAPDHLIILGPGNSLGAPVAQILVSMEWRGIRSKQDFQDYQKSHQFVISIDMDERQRKAVSRPLIQLNY